MKITSFAAKTLPAVTALLLAGSLTGCDVAAQAGAKAIDVVQSAAASAAPVAPAPAAPADPGAADDATIMLDSLPVKGRAPKTGYSRDEFGQAWADVDRNGCDTRNDILARDLEGETFKPGTNNCVVATGTLADKYTGTTIKFVRGQDTSSAVQIDHIIALSDAWQKGAQQLSPEQRKQLANDPLNLMAADGPTNGAKGDKDAATWLPPNKAFRCEYVSKQVSVKAKYQLWVTQAEHDAIAGILAGCK
ncbi:HNH endonuclease family protein [Pseudarthrobacter sp. BIM B-2242]|uniref:HNH endonuclease family protein n=1 Tax=Pseudarthrobacter sp. BIM B-2242 TaxID=2772401 RepID=UPI00351C65E7